MSAWGNITSRRERTEQNHESHFLTTDPAKHGLRTKSPFPDMSKRHRTPKGPVEEGQAK